MFSSDLTSTPFVGACLQYKSTAPCSQQPNSSIGRLRTQVRLDQFYTTPAIAAWCYAIFKQHFDPRFYSLVEPSAGEGAFFRLMPPGSRAVDIVPRHPGIRKANFLTMTFTSDREIAMIGNPPFGKNCSMAVKFFNHAAKQSSIIAFIVPRTFRKARLQNRLDRHFHLLCEHDVPRNAFTCQGELHDVPTVFQIWVRRSELRPLCKVETHHPDFEFTTPARADFAIQRIGHNAGTVHRNFDASPSSHYFIRAVVRSGRRSMQKTMAAIDFANVARDTAGCPSLAKSEVVELYRIALAKARPV